MTAATANPTRSASPALATSGVQPRTDFVITGFPKCGTSALSRLLGGVPGVGIDQLKGSLEAPFFMAEQHAAQLAAERQRAVSAGGSPSPVNGHKYVAYVYNQTAMRRLAQHDPATLLIVCVRDPLKSLISWRAMHRRIATSGSQPQHFAYADPVQRAFYAGADMAQYMAEFVKDRLQYAHWLRKAVAAAPQSHLWVVDQGVLAREPERIRQAFARHMGLPMPPQLPTPAAPHVGYADAAKPDEVPAEVLAAMATERAQLAACLDELASHPRVTVLR